MHNMRYLSSVVSNCFTAFGELLALNKRFAELSGGVTRCVQWTDLLVTDKALTSYQGPHQLFPWHTSLYSP